MFWPLTSDLLFNLCPLLALFSSQPFITRQYMFICLFAYLPFPALECQVRRELTYPIHHGSPWLEEYMHTVGAQTCLLSEGTDNERTVNAGGLESSRSGFKPRLFEARTCPCTGGVSSVSLCLLISIVEPSIKAPASWHVVALAWDESSRELSTGPGAEGALSKHCFLYSSTQVVLIGFELGASGQVAHFGASVSLYVTWRS